MPISMQKQQLSRRAVLWLPLVALAPPVGAADADAIVVVDGWVLRRVDLAKLAPPC